MSSRRITSSFLIAIFILSAQAVSPVSAGHRIQDTGRATISLEPNPRRDIPESATGIARFRLNKGTEGVSRLNVTVTVKNLPERARTVYEIWLVDLHGRSLNLSAFNTDNNGNAKVTIGRNIITMAPYDLIVVRDKRRETFRTDITGRILLSGRLHGPSEFDDEFDDDFDDSDRQDRR